MPTPTFPRPIRPACCLVVVALLAAACGDGDGEQGLAEARGVGRNFCSALEDFAASYAEVEQSDLAALRRDSQAIVEVIPAGAPAEVRAYFDGLAEMVELSAVWENPETDGIKEEYVDDFIRLLGATTGEPAAATESYMREQCQEPPGLGQLFAGEGGPLPSPSGDGGPTASVPPVPAEVLTVLDDGPAGIYEGVTVDIATVTATNAEPADAFSDDPVASAGSALLVEIDAATDGSAPNQFSADDFRLTDPSGTTTTAESVIDRSGGGAPMQLRGRDSTTGFVVFATDSLVRNLRGYRVSIDRDGRVPTVLGFSEPVSMPYPVALDTGASGTMRAPFIPQCSDDYETSVIQAEAGLDADLGDSQGIERSMLRERWVRVVLDVTNVTVPNSTCQGYSGNYVTVELRLEADGRSIAPANQQPFEKIEPGTTAERVHVFPVDAGASSLVLLGPGGETLGRWTVDLPVPPGEH